MSASMTQESTLISTEPKQFHFMPAEWEMHDATLLAWPHNRFTWPDHHLGDVEQVYLNLIRELTVTDRVLLLCGKKESSLYLHVEHTLRENGLNLDKIELVDYPTNDVWARDFGPIVVRSLFDNSAIYLDWSFNSWGGKYPPFDLDDRIPSKLASRYDVAVRSLDFVLEGGSIDVNGTGTLLTTESVLLNPNRNPAYSKQEIEEILSTELGIKQVIWLSSGLEGDDTDGHIDDLARFVNENTIFCCLNEDSLDPNYETLQENYRRLLDAKNLDGQSFHVIPIPMPDTRTDEKTVDGSDRLPASYANFYFSNGRILLPLYDADTDEQAISLFKKHVKGFEIVGIPCRDLVWGQGSIHCITQQIYGL